MQVPSRAPESPRARDAIRRLVPFSSLLLTIDALPSHREFEPRDALGDHGGGREPEVALRVCLAREHVAFGLLFLANDSSAHLPRAVAPVEHSCLACAATAIATTDRNAFAQRCLHGFEHVSVGPTVKDLSGVVNR